MMNRKQIFGVTAILLAVLLGGTSVRAADADFGKQMSAFSDSQQILQYFVSGKKMIDQNKLKAFWEPEIKKLYDSARVKPINQARTTAFAKMLETIEKQRYDEYQNFHRFIDDILNTAVSDDVDILCSIAVCWQLEIFLTKHKFDRDATDAIRESLKILTEFTGETLLSKVKERFEDDELKALVEDFEKLFPDTKTKLKFNSGSGCVNNIRECRELFDDAMKAYWNLNKCSALANFREWGTHMLNYLLLDRNPVMIDEFKKQMSNYRRTFKVQ